MQILKAIKDKKITFNLFDLKVHLAQSEHKFLFNKIKQGGIIL